MSRRVNCGSPKDAHNGKLCQSKRERAQKEVGKLLLEDPIFRDNFLKALNPHVSPIIRAVLELALSKQGLARTVSRPSPDSQTDQTSAD